MAVALVLVSHSADLAAGLAALAGQMAPDVAVTPVGGTAGELGTDFDAASAALDAHPGDVAVLYDLGSARMTAELAVEALDDPERAALVDAPFVEGTVAAAVAAQGGADLRAVAAAAAAALGTEGAASEGGPPGAASPGAEHAAGEPSRLTARLVNDVGLHARPAASLARAVTGMDARVTVAKGQQTADAASVLALLGLDARKGDTLEFTATGAHADAALAKARELVESGFGET